MDVVVQANRDRVHCDGWTRKRPEEKGEERSGLDLKVQKMKSMTLSWISNVTYERSMPRVGNGINTRLFVTEHKESGYLINKA